MGFFTQRTSGQIKKIMAEDVERIELFVAHHIPDLTTAMVLSSVLLFLIPASVYLSLHVPSYPQYVPTILLFLILGGGIFFPMMKLMWISGLLRQNTSGVSLVDEILLKEEISEPEHPEPPQTTEQGIPVEFRNVNFAYGNTPILKDVSFLAAPGTVTALVGPSGAGKSTVAMLTARFWDIQEGEILIGGIPIKNIPTETLMQTISFVFQDTMLFFDTIEENIRMGNKSASFEEVVSAAKSAQCHSFIEQLENGYLTLVGEGGTYLSGGEAQRISLARVILKNAPIVLLDEATAFADPENEGKILESFSHLIRGKTVLVIAHRLSTITSADQILVIDGGIIAEQGKHRDLLAKNGIYKRMWDSYTQSREWTLFADKKSMEII